MGLQWSKAIGGGRVAFIGQTRIVDLTETLGLVIVQPSESSSAVDWTVCETVDQALAGI